MRPSDHLNKPSGSVIKDLFIIPPSHKEELKTPIVTTGVI